MRARVLNTELQVAAQRRGEAAEYSEADAKVGQLESLVRALARLLAEQAFKSSDPAKPPSSMPGGGK